MIEFFKRLRAPRALARLLTPDVPREERKELGKSPAFVMQRDAITDLARIRQAAMHRRQLAIAQDLERTEHMAVNGLGTHIARIDLEAYHQQMPLHGEDCWRDPQFIEAYLRDNPACRVKVTRGTRGQEYGGRGRRTASPPSQSYGAASAESKIRPWWNGGGEISA